MPRPFVFSEDPLRTAALLRALADDLERLSMFVPSFEDLDGAPVLSTWRQGCRTANCLVGNVGGHPLLGDREVVTSELFAIDPPAVWARRASRVYRRLVWAGADQ